MAVYVRSMTVGPDGKVDTNHLKVEQGAEPEKITKQAFHQAGAAGHRRLVEVLTPVEVRPDVALWLGAHRFLGGVRWALVAPEAVPPAELETVAAAVQEAPAIAGLSPELVARAAYARWQDKRAELELKPAPAWEELTEPDRIARVFQGAQVLEVIARALATGAGK